MYLFSRYKHFHAIPFYRLLTEISTLLTLFCMKKDSLLIIPVCTYEAFRCLSIFVTRPEQYIEILPVSWYAGIFSLILPAVLAYLGFRKQENAWAWCYGMVKAAQDIGIVKYILDDWSYAVSTGFQNNYYSFNRIVALVSFLIIDVILLVVLLIYQHKRKDSNADNSSCER